MVTEIVQNSIKIHFHSIIYDLTSASVVGGNKKWQGVTGHKFSTSA